MHVTPTKLFKNVDSEIISEIPEYLVAAIVDRLKAVDE